MWKAWGLDGSFRPPGEPWIRMHRAQKNLPRRPRIIATPLCQGDSLAIRHLSTRPSAHAAAASLGWAWLNGGVFATLESYILPLTIWLRSKKLANGYCHLESHGTGQHCPSTSADIAQCFQFLAKTALWLEVPRMQSPSELLSRRVKEGIVGKRLAALLLFASFPAWHHTCRHSTYCRPEAHSR